MKKAEIISIGDEILIGQIINSNAAFIAKSILPTGFYPEWMTVVRDEKDRIFEAFRIALSRTDLVIVTGGLGSTHDDITKQTAAEFFECELVFDPETDLRVRSLFAARGRELSPSLVNQSYFPKGARILPNPIGTAAGIIFQADSQPVILLPGVPFEMKKIMENSVIPFLHSRKIADSIEFLTFHTTGIGESSLFEKIDNLNEILQEVKVAFLPRHTGVDIRLSAFAPTYADAKRRLSTAQSLLKSKIKAFITGFNEETLEGFVLKLLMEKRWTIAVAESCTGGLLSSKFTDTPGSSEAFMRGVIAYSNQSKIDLLGVPEELIEKHGAVSPEVAASMAEGIRLRSRVDIGISTTGIAGPGGSTASKPVGLIFIGLSSKEGIRTEKHIFTSDRETNKMRFSQAALECVRKHILSAERQK